MDREPKYSKKVKVKACEDYVEATAIRCINISSERYVLGIYENGILKYPYYSSEHYKELEDYHIKNTIDSDTNVFKILENIEEVENKYISKKFSEDIQLWFEKCKHDYKVTSQVYIHRKPNKEYF
ncbi:hypothetical protein GOQ27_07895 [Clostridium sp. D2Q-11]|uniref:Uncharacterized protein n=1 Tax=Anaeromonas frigoriresistens TaxID=2683708 RepID=A0A942USL5_9FIRM|nr:hypothetical protein [Anaeromonas frigoriresistens]MBS4538383.1 hypothetical protein [Anaeromonas frigoriresistens]